MGCLTWLFLSWAGKLDWDMLRDFQKLAEDHTSGFQLPDIQ